MIHGAEVVHHVPGRMRVKLPRSKRTPYVLREIRQFVSGLGGVHRVEINAVTGSILVYYNPESHEEMQSLAASAQHQDAPDWEQPPELTDADEIAERIEKEAEFLAAHSELAYHVVNSVKALNRSVREATGNTVDLKVLLPAGLAVWAFFKAGADVSTPLWVTLGIFSFNSFVALHHPPHTVHVQTHRTALEG